LDSDGASKTGDNDDDDDDEKSGDEAPDFPNQLPVQAEPALEGASEYYQV
jgi:hypothetical protein